MKILTEWLRSYLPVLEVDDAQLAEDLTLHGIAVEGIFELSDAAGDSEGSLFDMDITTNRVDAMNHYGIAREAAAIYNLHLKPLNMKLPAPQPGQPFPVRINSPKACGRFTAQIIRDVTIAPTHGVIEHYFRELNQKSISNAVDISNFVLLGMGHPNHVFDLDTIEGGIVVRNAHPGEQIKLLDGTTRTLVAEDLVIADEVKALSLAGVMGGLASSITAATKNILVEAAWFDPATIRASSRRHLIHTDASHRYERGADFAACPIASPLVTQQILAACGGHVEGPLVDIITPAAAALTIGRAPITLSVARTQQLLGKTLDQEGITSALIARYLKALGCTLTATSDDAFEVHLPSWRLDLTRPIDLVEEIARVYGYNRFANTLPTPAPVTAHKTAKAEQAIRALLLTLGFTEALSSTFASAAESALFAPHTQPVSLENPLSEEAANLRPSLLPGMLTMLAHNLNRDTATARLFEAGHIFATSGQEVTETLSLALGMTGTEASTPPLNVAKDAPFYELKGAVEGLVGMFKISKVDFAADPLPLIYAPGRAAVALLNGRVVASFGQLTAAEEAKRKLRQPVWLAELDLSALLAYPLRQPIARELSRYQAAERDFSVTFPNSITWQAISSAIEALKIDELQKLLPVELWRNEAKFPGVYSTLVRTHFQSHDRTLRDEELTAWSDAIITVLQALGGSLRTS